MKYFANCQTLDEIKQLFKKLALENHPDRGGDTATMQAINSEYKFAIAALAKNAGKTAKETEAEVNLSEAYQNAINKIAGLDGLIIELVGCWVWVTGNTYQHKQILREAGYLWAGKKQAWYFRTEDNKVRSRKRQDLETIKNKYGCTQIRTSKNFLHA